MGTAVFMIMTNNTEIMVIVNQAAFHDDATTLLSEYQLREFGIVVDAVSKDHQTDHKGG